MKRDSRSILAHVLASDVRAAERRHVKLMENTAGLPAKPFLGGTSLDVDRALTEIRDLQRDGGVSSLRPGLARAGHGRPAAGCPRPTWRPCP